MVSHFRAGRGALRRAKRGGDEERSREGLEAEPEQPAQLADVHQSSCRTTVAIWRNCDSRLIELVRRLVHGREPQSRTWCGLTHSVGALVRHT